MQCTCACSTIVCPHVCSTIVTPGSPLKCLAANSSNVSDAALKSIPNINRLFHRNTVLSESGKVKTTWKYSTGSNAAFCASTHL
jgi:hypothetical protein